MQRPPGRSARRCCHSGVRAHGTIRATFPPAHRINGRLFGSGALKSPLACCTSSNRTPASVSAHCSESQAPYHIFSNTQYVLVPCNNSPPIAPFWLCAMPFFGRGQGHGGRRRRRLQCLRLARFVCLALPLSTRDAFCAGPWSSLALYNTAPPKLRVGCASCTHGPARR